MAGHALGTLRSHIGQFGPIFVAVPSIPMSPARRGGTSRAARICGPTGCCLECIRRIRSIGDLDRLGRRTRHEIDVRHGHPNFEGAAERRYSLLPAVQSSETSAHRQSPHIERSSSHHHARLEERSRRTRALDRSGLKIHRKHFAVRTEIEKLLAVLAPQRLAAAFLRAAAYDPSAGNRTA